MWLIFLKANWKSMFVAALIAVSLSVAYSRGADSVQVKWDLEKAQASAEAFAIALAAQKERTKKQEEYHDNLAEIDRLRANNHALWLRLPKTPCTPSLPSVAKNGAAAGGELHVEVPAGGEDTVGRAEQLINDFKGVYDGESLRADKIVEECRKVVESEKPRGE